MNTETGLLDAVAFVGAGWAKLATVEPKAEQRSLWVKGEPVEGSQLVLPALPEAAESHGFRLVNVLLNTGIETGDESFVSWQNSLGCDATLPSRSENRELFGRATAGRSLLVDVGRFETEFVLAEAGRQLRYWVAEVGAESLLDKYLLSDPPDPADLSAALSIVELHVDDAKREISGLAAAVEGCDVYFSGLVETIAAVEVGLLEDDPSKLDNFLLEQAAAEDVFRTLATEDAEDRAHNPGLPQAEVGRILGSSCIVVETMRQLAIEKATVANWLCLDGLVAKLLDS